MLLDRETVPATLQFASGSGTSTQTSLSVSPGSTLDINNNRFIIDYGAAANDPIASIAADIISGYHNGRWTGTGITSTAAQSNYGSYGIGYADSADPNNPAGLAPGTIEIMYTLLGDANLDGTVNSEDFTLFSNHLGQSGMSWDEGDFNYDGTVNSEDFTLLSDNLGQSVVSSANLAADAPSRLNPAKINRPSRDREPTSGYRHPNTAGDRENQADKISAPWALRKAVMAAD